MAADWFKPLRNAGMLLTGKAARGVLGFGAVAVAARALGVEVFGTLVLITGTVMTLGKVLRIPTGHLVVSYGAEPYRDRDWRRLRELLGFGVVLDLLSTGIALGLLFLLAPLAVGWFGLPDGSANTLRLYGLVLPIVGLGTTPISTLRLLDRFDLIAGMNPLVSLGRLLGGLGLWLGGAGLGAFLALWALTTVLVRLIRIGVAGWELNRQGILVGWEGRALPSLRPEHGVWRFLGGAYANNSLDLNKSQLPTLVVGAVLGPAGAGLFRIALQLANVVIKPANKLLVSAILPDLAHLRANGQRKARRKMVRRTGTLAGLVAFGIFLGLALFGKTIIAWTAGPAYTEAYSTMLLLALAGVVMAWIFPLEPLLISAGKVWRLALIRGAAFGIYLAVLIPASSRFELLGAGLAALAQTAFMLVMLLILSRSSMRVRKGHQAPAAP